MLSMSENFLLSYGIYLPKWLLGAGLVAFRFAIGQNRQFRLRMHSACVALTTTGGMVRGVNTAVCPVP